MLGGNEGGHRIVAWQQDARSKRAAVSGMRLLEDVARCSSEQCSADCAVQSCGKQRVPGDSQGHQLGQRNDAAGHRASQPVALKHAVEGREGLVAGED